MGRRGAHPNAKNKAPQMVHKPPHKYMMSALAAPECRAFVHHLLGNVPHDDELGGKIMW